MLGKVGIFGSDGTVIKAYSMNTTDFLGSVGANTGNLFFQYAVYNQIAEDRCIIGKDLPWDVNLIKNECRILVIPSANFLRENSSSRRA